MQIYEIDLSKEKFDVSYVDSKGNYKGLIVKNNLTSIAKFVENLPSDTCLCAEYTGCYGDTSVFICNQLNIPISLTPGYTVKHSLGMVRLQNLAKRFVLQQFQIGIDFLLHIAGLT